MISELVHSLFRTIGRILTRYRGGVTTKRLSGRYSSSAVWTRSSLMQQSLSAGIGSGPNRWRGLKSGRKHALDPETL